MGKPIPKPKAKAKAKSKRLAEIKELVDPKSQKKAERKIEAFLMTLDERSEVREEYVKKILSVNDDSISEIVQKIVESLQRMQGEPKLIFEGRSYNPIKGQEELLKNIQLRNFRWMAVRCLVSLAEWDIRVGNLKLPKKVCSRCGKKVK